MFKCGLCQGQSGMGETAVRVTTEIEPVVYPYRGAAHHFVVEGSPKVRDDPGGQGFQIVSEVFAHASCAKKFTNPKVIIPDETN